MMVTPKNGYVCIEIKKFSDKRAQEIKKKTGLELVSPEYEGLPTEGIVYMLPENYEGELEAGLHVVYKEQNPKGYRVDGKEVLFTKEENIIAILPE